MSPANEFETCSVCGASISKEDGSCPRCLLVGILEENPTIPAEEYTPSLSLEIPGEMIDRYKLIDQIGEGGMGRVFVAEQKQPFRRMVALKVIKPGMDSKEVLSRFEAERQAIALMDHSCIARVYDAGTTENGLPYFVMELVEGKTITEFCDEKKLSLKERLDLFRQVCHAVQHAHQKGIIHRDLKPSNILVTTDPEKGDQPVPKIIDFGVAKALGPGLTEHTLYTAAGQIIGTPQYMSPEQAVFDATDVDTRADIYSLGVLLYELLTGRTPLEMAELRKAGLEAVLKTIREQDAPRPSAKVSKLENASRTTIADARKIPLSKLTHTLRGDLDWIVMKALEKERSRRYETANAFAADIGRYLAHEAVDASPPSPAYRFKKFARRNRGILWAATAILLTLLAGLATTVWQADQARLEKKRAQQARTEAEKLVTFMLGDLKKSLEPVGRLDLMSGVGKTVLDYYDRIEEKSIDPNAQLQQGRAFIIIGKVAENTGKPVEAEEFNSEAIKLIEAYISQAGESPEAASALADAYEAHAAIKGASLWGRPADLDKALDFSRRAAELRQKLRDGTNEVDLKCLRALTHLVQRYRETGNNEEAQKQLAVAIKLAEKLDDSKNSSLSVKVLKANLMLEGDFLDVPKIFFPDRWVENADRLEAAVWKVLYEVYRQNPDDAEIVSDLANLLRYKYDRSINEDSGQFLALKLASDLHQRDPGNRTWTLSVARLYFLVGSNLSFIGRTSDSWKYLESGFQIYEKLLRQEPENISLKSEASSRYRQYGWSYRTADKAKARKYYERCLELIDEIEQEGYVEEAKHSRLWPHLWIITTIKNAEERIPYLEEILPTAKTYINPSNDSQISRNMLFYVHSGLSSNYSAIGEQKKSLYHAESAVKVVKDFRATSGQENALMENLARGYGRLATTKKALGEVDEARILFRSALEIYLELMDDPALAFVPNPRSGFMNSVCVSLKSWFECVKSPTEEDFHEILVNVSRVSAWFGDLESDDSSIFSITGKAERLLLSSAQAMGKDAHLAYELLNRVYTNAIASNLDLKNRQIGLKLEEHHAHLLTENTSFVDSMDLHGELPGLILEKIQLLSEQTESGSNKVRIALLLFVYKKQLEALGSAEGAQSPDDNSGGDLGNAVKLLTSPDFPESELTVDLLDRTYRIAKKYKRVEFIEALLLEKVAIQRSSMEKTKLKSVAETLVQLADFLRQQKRLDEALKFLEEAGELRMKFFGEGHIKTGWVENIRGQVCFALKDYEIAEKHYLNALKACNAKGSESLHSATLLGLGKTCRRVNDLKRAEQYLQVSLSLREGLFGKDHQNLTEILHELAFCLWDGGKTEESIVAKQRAIQIKRKHLGETPERWLNDYLILAEWMNKTGKYSEAESVLVEFLDIHKQRVPDDGQRYIALSKLGFSLTAQKKYAAAEANLLEAIEGFKSRIGINSSVISSDIMNCKENLKSLYSVWNPEKK